MMCHRMGRFPMGTIGLGMVGLYSLIRVPRPPHRMIVGIDSPASCHLPSVARYQATVRSSPSSKVWAGFHPSTARAFSAERYWWEISPDAVALMSGSNDVPTAACMSATTSSTLRGARRRS